MSSIKGAGALPTGTASASLAAERGRNMVMTFAKITAGTGYLYLVRQTALGDAEPTARRDAAALTRAPRRSRPN